ncbi:MAG: hypothetical protein ACP5T7_09015 [bacterium]
MIKRKVLTVAFLGLMLLLTGVILAGCQSTTKQQVQPGQEVTLSGVMQSGTPIGIASYAFGLLDALVNYKLYCVTFEDNPVAAKGSADSSGRFSLKIKSYTPFGCFVLDPSDKHVADLLFAGLSESADTYAGSIMLTDNVDVGTIVVDTAKGLAVVDLSGKPGVSGSIDNPFDPTGEWKFSCISPPNDPVYSCPKEMPSSVYLHRISGVMSPGNKKVYGLSVWESKANFDKCGSVEGLGDVSGTKVVPGPITGSTVTLDTPDGPFTYDYDNIWQVGMDNQTTNEWGQCGAPITLTCSQITNTANWGYSDGNIFHPFTDGQCQQQCFANSYWKLKFTAQYCIEERDYMWTQANMQYIPSTALNNDNDTPWVKFHHTPASRHIFEQFVYTSNTSGSMVAHDWYINSIWDPITNNSYTCALNFVMNISVTQQDANTLLLVLDRYGKLAPDSPTSACMDSTIPNNHVLEDLRDWHVLVKLTK